MIQLIGETTEAITRRMTEMGLPAYRGKQIADWLYRRGPRQDKRPADFGSMTDLPTALRAELSAQFDLAPLELLRNVRDRIDGTVKIVATTRLDRLEIESVLMPDERRVSVCLSTQAGCPMGCIFCATGTQGLARNLSTAEIVAQFLLLRSLSPRPITHVVFMGMGEPLLNLPALLASITILNREIGLSMRHITVSTVGIVAAIRKLAEEDLPINLAISLHAPTDELRRSIVPRHKSLTELIDAARSYFEHTGREITFEYVLLRGVNDGPDEARQLADLLREFPSCTVNLIPYNATSVAQPLRRPEGTRVRAFRVVLEAAGLRVTQRKERGREIAAACGQLVTQSYRSRTGEALPMAAQFDSAMLHEGLPEPMGATA